MVVTRSVATLKRLTEPVVLFDSVYEFSEIATEEHLHIDLPPGDYRIEAGYIEAPTEYLILVRLLHDQPSLPAGREGKPAVSNDQGDLQC